MLNAPNAGGKHAFLDAHRIIHRLWVGSEPTAAPHLDFDVHVACAPEFHAAIRSRKFRMPGGHPVLDLYVDLDDSTTPNSGRRMTAARDAAQQIAKLHVEGKRILVTCAQGRNRSAFIAALVLRAVTGCPPHRIVAHVKQHRRPPGSWPALSEPPWMVGLPLGVDRDTSPPVHVPVESTSVELARAADVPPVTPPVRPAFVEKRAARARAAVVKWGRKLKVAERTLAKWRRKVRYYEP